MKLLSYMTLTALLTISACSHHSKSCCDKPCCTKEKKCADGSCAKPVEAKKDCAGESCQKKKS
jgi:hypothetical protein